MSAKCMPRAHSGSGLKPVAVLHRVIQGEERLYMRYLLHAYVNMYCTTFSCRGIYFLCYSKV